MIGNPNFSSAVVPVVIKKMCYPSGEAMHCPLILYDLHTSQFLPAWMDLNIDRIQMIHGVCVLDEHLYSVVLYEHLAHSEAFFKIIFMLFWEL